MNDRLSNQFGRPPLDLVEQSQPRFTFCQSDDGMAAAFSQDRIDFPVTEAFSLFNDLWALVNTHSIQQLASTVIAPIALAAFLLAAQVYVQLTASLFISQYVLIDPLMTDPHPGVLPQPAGNLLRTPILTQKAFNPHPGLFGDSRFGFLASTQRQLVSLFGPVTTLATVPPQFSAHRGFVHPNDTGDHSFDLLVSRGLSYSSLPLSTIKVALTS
ncbi:MAG: hypothetical protein AMJ53_10400 [Gammaproteobacteria bacterium SG8_11]|nr:MAG: hypothetical protein AMJ53_10400 [Gammaproteobacteria bacterium SG8_11]